MKRAIITILILCSILVLTSFENEENCQIKGEVIGFDATRCGCCGGWKIAIGNAVYLTDSIPKGILDIGPDGCHVTPQPIFLDYEKEYYCNYKRIRITCISRRTVSF